MDGRIYKVDSDQN